MMYFIKCKLRGYIRNSATNKKRGGSGIKVLTRYLAFHNSGMLSVLIYSF